MKFGKMIYPACVVLAAVLWGCMGLLVRDMNVHGFTSMEIVIFRTVITAVVMAAVVSISDKNAFRIKLKDIWCFIGTGLFSIVFFNVCYFSCMNHTTLGVAAILLYTAPTFVTVMSIFLFKEKLTASKIICLILAFAGCALVSGGFGDSAIGIKGLLLGLGAGFGYALYSIFGKFAINRGYGSTTITTYTFAFASVGALPFVDMKHFTSCLSNAAGSLWYDILMVLFNTVIAYLLYTKGLSGMENGKASVLASIEPVIAAIVGVVVFHETLGLMAVIGIILVLSACLFNAIGTKS